MSLLNTPGIIESLSGQIVISLLAGVTYYQLKAVILSGEAAGRETSFARVLPSLGEQIGRSVSLVADPEGGFTDHDRREIIQNLFTTISTITYVLEA